MPWVRNSTVTKFQTAMGRLRNNHFCRIYSEVFESLQGCKRRIKGARKDGRMPRKEELQEIIDFASADSFLDKMLVEGKYSIITGGMGLDHVDSDFIAGRLKLYESTSFLISKGLRRSDCRVFADGKSNPVYFDVIDSMEKINDNFKDLKQDLQEYPINWEHNFEIDDISARIKTTLDCFRNSEDATNELLRASRSPINKNPLQEITLDELRLTLELLVKLNENHTRISKIHDELKNQKLNIAPLYSVEMRDLSQSEEHLAGIEDLLSKQKNGFNEASLKQLFDGDELKSISSTLKSAIDGFKRSKSIFRRHFDIDISSVITGLPTMSSTTASTSPRD